MSEPSAPKIEFPCDNYPIKVIGDNHPALHDQVVEIMQKHAPGIDLTEISAQVSRNGSFVSIRVRICATGESQLKSIHAELLATGRVKMVM